MLIRFFAVALAVFFIVSAPLGAEVIITNDGSSITGELVGFEGGYYHIQIGKFIKKIPEGRVKEIRDASTQASSPSPTVRRAQPVSTTKKASDSSSVNPFSSLFGGGTGSVPTAGKPAMSGETEKMLRDAVRMQKDNPMLRNLMGGGTAGGAGGMQDLLKSDGNLEQLKQLQGNPAMEMFVNRFKDKKFQDTFLREIEAMNQDLSPGKKNPHVETLKALFEQLNNAGSMQPGK